jgi:pSer/pThr/pTyr-binding forkhead associated (FHA) protein
MGYQLTYLSGANQGLTVEFSQNVVFIGRDPGIDMVINEPHVSENHAKLAFRGEQVFIEDLGSTNGTFVNGRRITSPVPLNSGDTVQLGTDVKLRFTALSEDFSDRTVVGKPQELPDYIPSQKPAPFQEAPQKKSFPKWIIFAVIGVVILCGGVILLGGGGLVILNWFSNPESRTQEVADAALIETDQAVLISTQMAMTEAPYATETAQAAQAMTQQAQETAQAQASATAAAIEFYWGVILDGMGTNPLFGPESGTLSMVDDGNVEALSASVDYMNVIITADFFPSYQSDEALWDVGFFFRDQGTNDELRLRIESGGEYYVQNRIGEDENNLVEGTINNLNLSENTPNTVVLMVWEDKCVLFVNNQFIAEIDISVRMMSGNVSIVTNIKDENFLPGAETRYENFTIYAVPLQ